MERNVANDTDVFLRMTREFPVRTGIYTFGLPMLAFFQVINGFIHGGSIVFIGVFSAFTVACSILLTQYQIAAYRRKRLAQRLI